MNLKNRRIHPCFLTELPNLRWLDFSDNHLMWAPSLEEGKNLSKLSIKNNYIRKIHSFAFEKQKKLQKVALGNEEGPTIKVVQQAFFGTSLKKIYAVGRVKIELPLLTVGNTPQGVTITCNLRGRWN